MNLSVAIKLACKRGIDVVMLVTGPPPVRRLCSGLVCIAKPPNIPKGYMNPEALLRSEEFFQVLSLTLKDSRSRRQPGICTVSVLVCL